MRKQSGQILILVLLIVVVALAVGLSVASRNITNLKTSTQTEHSQRAFSAAEGGIEDVLSRELIPGNYSVPVGNITASVTVQSSSIYTRTIDLGDVGQIDLTGATGELQIEWAQLGDGSESPPASLEVTIIKENSGIITQSRRYYQGDLSRSSDETTGPGVSFDTITNCSTSEYTKCTRVNLAGETGAKILRIKPFWVRTTVKVSCISPCALTNQTYEITSTAQSELGLTRKVQVTRTALPQLPAVFDYALFSESDIIK